MPNHSIAPRLYHLAKQKSIALLSTVLPAFLLLGGLFVLAYRVQAEEAPVLSQSITKPNDVLFKGETLPAGETERAGEELGGLSAGSVFLSTQEMSLRGTTFNSGLQTRNAAWQGSTPGLRGDYYNNKDLATPIVMTRFGEVIDFNWGAGSPAPEINHNQFSIRWTGQVEPEFSETYTFITTSDDGVRLWIDGQLIIDNWTVHASTEDSGNIALQGGQKYDLRLEYFENLGGAIIKLEWQSNSTTRQVIPIERLSYSGDTDVDFFATLAPTSATLNAGGEASYAVHVLNTGNGANTYTFDVSGLDPEWLSLEPAQFGLVPGASGQAVLTVAPPGCQAETTLPFTIVVEAVEGGQIQILAGNLTLTQSPDIVIDSPAPDITTGADRVLFQWRTTPVTASTLTLYPASNPSQTQVYTTAPGSLQRVLVEDLDREETYEWYVEAESACGTAASAPRTFTVSSGIVFTDHELAYTVERDYNQLVSVAVRNDDDQPHTLLMTMQHPYDDLLVNFVGSGSVDEVITLEPEEEREVTLAIHLQDAQSGAYVLTAHIEADEGSGTPLIDTASIQLTVLSEADYSVTQIGNPDPQTGALTYRITNNGLPLTDLAVNALADGSDLPASVFLKPNISHGYLGTGQSVDVQITPLYGPEHVGEAGPPIDVDLRVAGGSGVQTLPTSLGCPGGGSLAGANQVYAVTRQNVCLPLPNKDWYCTNRPDVTTQFSTPAFINNGALLSTAQVSSVDLRLRVNPWSNVLPHSTSFSFNGQALGGFENLTPFGTYSIPLSPDLLNTNLSGPAVQQVRLNSQHTNGGHYVVATDFTLGIGLDSVTTYVCAASHEAAEAVVDTTYGFESLSRTSLCAPNTLPESATWNSGGDACVGAAASGTQVTAGGPINTRTGAYDYAASDLRVATAAGPLTFQRW